MGERISVVDRSMRRTLPKSILLPIAGVANLTSLSRLVCGALDLSVGTSGDVLGKIRRIDLFPPQGYSGVSASDLRNPHLERGELKWHCGRFL